MRGVIREQVKEAGYYAIIADESKDFSKLEQLSICLRYVYRGNVHERFLCLIQLGELDAAAISKSLHKALTDMQLDPKMCVGWVSVMMVRP